MIPPRPKMMLSCRYGLMRHVRRIGPMLNVRHDGGRVNVTVAEKRPARTIRSADHQGSEQSCARPGPSVEGAKNENQLLRAIESVKGVLPQALLINGHNPYRRSRLDAQRGSVSGSRAGRLKRSDRQQAASGILRGTAWWPSRSRTIPSITSLDKSVDDLLPPPGGLP